MVYSKKMYEAAKQFRQEQIKRGTPTLESAAKKFAQEQKSRGGALGTVKIIRKDEKGNIISEKTGPLVVVTKKTLDNGKTRRILNLPAVPTDTKKQVTEFIKVTNRPIVVQRIEQTGTGVSKVLLKDDITGETLKDITVPTSSKQVRQGRIEKPSKDLISSTATEKIREELKYSPKKVTFKGQVGRLLKGTVVLGTLGAFRGAKGVITSIRHPITTAKQILRSFVHPLDTLEYMGKEFVIDPIGVVAEFYVYNKGINAVSTGVKKSPVGRFVSEELFIRTQPKKLQRYVRAIIKSAKVQEAINPFNVKNISKVNFLEVKTLSLMEAKALAKTLTQTDSIVFGSVSARTLSKKKTKLPHDVDLATKNINVFFDKFKNNLPKKLQKNYRLVGEKILNIQRKQSLFDIKGIDRIRPEKGILNKGQLPIYVKKGTKLKQASLTFPTQKIVKVGKIKLVGFGEQTVRKALGTLQVLLEKNPKRAKDPAAFIEALEIQLKALKLKKTKTPFGRLKNNSRIKTLSNALQILKSKSFEKLLNSKVPLLTKKYPLVARIPKQRLVFAKKNIKKIMKKVEKTIKRKLKIKKSFEKSYLPKSLISRSKFPKSRMTKSRIPKSRMPKSRIPKSKLSKSQVSKSQVSKPKISKLKKHKISKFPKSRIPKSRIPKSRMPKSRIPKSKLSKSQVSKSQMPKSQIPKSKKYKKSGALSEEEEKRKMQKFKKKKSSKSKGTKRKTRYTRTLLGTLTGKGVKKGSRKVYTGLERRA